MRIVKEVRTLHPTVQYGNIELISRYEYDSETDLLDKESRVTFKKLDKVITRTVTESWSNLRDYVENEIKNELGRLEPDGKEKKKIKKVIGTGTKRLKYKR